MTFSLLAYDAETEVWGGVSATGNLCVGGWVLHGRSDSGICASQGQSPSTLWRENVLELQRVGMSAHDAIAQVTSGDQGRDHRQVSAIDAQGRPAVFSGASNSAYCGHLLDDDLVATGNILAGPSVLEAMIEAFRIGGEAFAERLIAALEAARKVGGDARGTRSAALLRIGRDAPPLSLRIDCAEDPVADLRDLYDKTTNADYQAWLATVPTDAAPWRAPPEDAPAEAE